MKKTKIFALTAFTLLLLSCESDEVNSESILEVESITNKLVKIDLKEGNANNTRKGKNIRNWMISMNESLSDSKIQLEKVEFLGADKAGSTVFFENRGNKQLTSDFVPNDPRNAGGEEVPYWIDETELGTTSGMSESATEKAINNTMSTWGSVSCSTGLETPNWGYSGFDVGLVQNQAGFGGFNGYIPGTILHAGILSQAFFDTVFGPADGANVLAVTFTFTYTEDLDNNGKGDVAIKEIYVNDSFNWQDEPNDVLGNGIYDFETVVLHEVGHGLSQGHFGKAFGNNGGLHFAPYALMNAGYTIGNRVVTGSDEAGHCSNWGGWPNN